MGDVRSPHPADAMAGTVEPVIEKILRDHQRRNAPDTAGYIEPAVLVHPVVHPDHRQPGQRIGTLVHQRQRGVRQRVADRVDVALAAPVPRFPEHTHHEHRCQRQQYPRFHQSSSRLSACIIVSKQRRIAAVMKIASRGLASGHASAEVKVKL